MSLLTYNNIADGTSIEAADLNAPINDIAGIINGNIDSTNITAASITASKLAADQNLNTFRAASIVNFCSSGCVWTKSAGLIGAMTGGTVYIDGVPVTVNLVASKTFTASKDTYVDVGTDGVVDYYPLANGAASQALEASHFRLAKVVTDGTQITNSAASATVPSFQQGIDSLGNTIFNTSPYGIIQWYFPSLQNSWVNYTNPGFAPASYGKTKAGMVYIQGLIQSGTVTAATNLFTLPVGFRPAVTVLLPADKGAYYQLRVLMNGQVNVGDTVASATYTSIACNFMAAGGN